MCECLQLTVQKGDGQTEILQLPTTGTFNGFNTYEFVYETITYYIWHDASDNWYVTTTPVGDNTGIVCELKNTLEPCPIADIPQWITSLFDTFSTVEGDCGGCGCFTITSTPFNGEPYIETFTTPTGFFNGSPYFSWCIGGFGYNLYLSLTSEGCRWLVEQTKCGADPKSGNVIFAGSLNAGDCGCPYDTLYTNTVDEWETFTAVSCIPIGCVPVEDRHQRKYDAVQLPVIFDEQNRGWKGCCSCEPMPTLASPDPETWKNDVTSAWIKMSDPTDTVQFILQKDGIDTIYTPSINPFINESDAYYTTIRWIDVLNSDGVGCYELKVSYNISGVIGEFVWGAYNLKPYSIENALKTARIRVKLNLQQEIEDINFTGTNIEDTIRFCGFIGERQPNMEIDNLIYQNRGMKTVVRENLNTYKITTDPTGECLTTKLTDLYLLSENEMWISDYNAHNHSYKYLDLPVVVQESPELDYLDILQRKAILTCEVGDRRKNKRTFY